MIPRNRGAARIPIRRYPPVQILRPDAQHPLRKRLWQAALAVGLVMTVLVAHEIVVRATDGSHRWSLGADYLPVYAAGTLVRTGRGGELYAIDPLARIEQQVVRDADLEPLPFYGPFLNPPFFAALYAPLSALPYRESAAAWLGINLLLLAGSIFLLCRMLPPGAGWRGWGLIPLLIVLPMPFWQAICHEQNTFLSLFLLCCVVSLWRRCARPRPPCGLATRDETRGSGNIPILAGAIAGLLFYKPQFACAVALLLVITLGWRAFLGLSITGAVLLLFTVLKMPGTLGSYLHALPPTVQWIQNRLAYNWGRQVTPFSFWRLLLQGHALGPTHQLPQALAIAAMTFAALALGAAALRYRQRGTDGASLERLIAATIAAMPLMVPYFMDYDLLLLSIPATLLAAGWMRLTTAPARADWLLLWAWVALFLTLYVNPGLAGQTRFNLAVPAIGFVAALSIGRCFVKQVAAAQPQRYDVAVHAVAA
jgi:alpha-1,2-mannosyltransferase